MLTILCTVEGLPCKVEYTDKPITIHSIITLPDGDRAVARAMVVTTERYIEISRKIRANKPEEVVLVDGKEKL